MSDVAGYIASIGPLQWVGVGGFVVYMIAFTLVQLGRLDGNGSLYPAFNVLAATLVGVGLIAEFNLASALIQASWIGAGVTGLLLRLRAPGHRLRPPRDQDLPLPDIMHLRDNDEADGPAEKGRSLPGRGLSSVETSYPAVGSRSAAPD